MKSLELNKFPPKLIHDFEFTDEEYFEESDFQDQISIPLGTQYFHPEWNSNVRTDYSNVNHFCPYCGHFSDFGASMKCVIPGTDHICLAHKKCIQKKQNDEIQLQFQKSSYMIQKGYLQNQMLSSSVGGKQFILSSTISHPLSEFKYFKLDKKLVIQEGLVQFNIEPSSDETAPYDPNKIILPLPQIKIKFNLRQIGSQTIKQNMTVNLDLSQIFVGLEITEKHSVWTITASNTNSWTAKIQVHLIFDELMKKQQVQAMNFKYQYPLMNNFPLVKINKIVLGEKSYQNRLIKSGIQNTKASSTYEEIILESDEDYSISDAPIIPIRVYEPRFNTDLRTLAKSQSGSKQLQKKLKEMKTQQINAFIDEIAPYITQLLEDDYANYMIQTLITVSNSKQRLSIFQSMKENIPKLVQLKQGTFAFQQMISFIQTDEQYRLITQIMKENFVQVATNMNGNHFLRKLISILPFRYNEEMIKKIFQNFVDLVNNKNSVCVLKVILNVLSKQNQNPSAKQIKKKLIDTLTMNTEKIIKNQFGNYFIQEAFEVFGQRELRGISQLIFNKFKTLSKQKFSSSVICKCISNYWKGTQYYERLKFKISSGQITELFKNKEGNKVLLELMISEADFAFKDKISSATRNHLPSKFNGPKWANATGSKTVRVEGQNYLSFSDALKDCEQKYSPMAKKRNYNIH